MSSDKELGELGEQWHVEYQQFMNNARASEESNGLDNEFHAQQALYTKYSERYDAIMNSESELYNGFNILANAINDQVGDKHLKILDFGCGTGLLGQALHDRNYKDIEGSDCNTSLLKTAEERNIYKNLYNGRGASNIPNLRAYDIIASSGTFFLSGSHPGTETIAELIKLVKRGGSLILLVKKEYLNKEYVDWSVVQELIRKDVVEESERVYVPGYRKPFEFEKDTLSMAAILHYKVLQ